MSKLKHISKTKYRAVISDVLPFERPIFFSNRYFARFLEHYGVQTNDGRLMATKNAEEKGLDVLLRILGGERGDKRSAFQYEISRGLSHKPRLLTIIHPYHQVEIAEFYEQYKMLLIDFCNRSNASLRYPVDAATKKHYVQGIERLVFDRDGVEDIDEGLKHYFVYQHCENINHFYEDDLFYKAEMQFSKMLKMDLEDCFESIQINDLSKATFGRAMDDCADTFVKRFAELQMEFREYDQGIIIGPEFSRIYAEIILQHIDSIMELRMLEYGYHREKDYVFYRYVDDGFLFINDIEVRDCWETEYSRALSLYGLSLNEDKRKEYDQRPFVDSIAVVKSQIADLVSHMFESRLSTFIGFQHLQAGRFDTPTKINDKLFIKQYRLILKSSTNQIESKDITVYALGLIKKHIDKLLTEFNRLYKEYKKADIKGGIDDKGRGIMKSYEEDFLEFLLNMVRILFFLLMSDTRMVTSTRVISLVHKMQLFVRGLYRFEKGVYSDKFNSYTINSLDEEITHSTNELLQFNTRNNDTIMEVLNVLNLQRLMIPNARISAEALLAYLNADNKVPEQLNFFIVFELLHFIEKCATDEYAGLNSQLYDWISAKIRELKVEKNSSTESVLVCTEMLCSPMVHQEKKRMILECLGANEDSIEESIQFIEKQKDMFIKWRNYKIDHEIVQFENNNVY